MALRKVFNDPFTSSTKGSFAGNFFEPHNTECSNICATPVESFEGVLKPIVNTLLLSSVSNAKILAFVFLCSSIAAFALSSSISDISTTLYADNFLILFTCSSIS